LKKNYRDKEGNSDFNQIGKVITENPNIVTNPYNKKLFKHPEHLKDEYNRIKEL